MMSNNRVVSLRDVVNFLEGNVGVRAYGMWSALRVRSSKSLGLRFWGFPKIRGTILGVPILRTIVYLGLYWGPPILGNYLLEAFEAQQLFVVAEKG